MRDRYEQETKKAFDNARTVYVRLTNYGQKRPALDIVHMLYSYDPDGTIGAGTRLSVQQASKMLKPFNMKAVSTWKGKMILVVQRDFSKPVPTNWATVVDTVLVWHPDEVLKEASETAMKCARFRRKSWKNLCSK